MPVPNTFANATATIPLSQLDANFATTITLGNTAIQLGNTVSTLNNMTLANVTVTSGNVTITNVTVTTANVTTANIATEIVTTSQTLNYGTANCVAYLNTNKVTTANTGLAYDGSTFRIGSNTTRAAYFSSLGIPTFRYDDNAFVPLVKLNNRGITATGHGVGIYAYLAGDSVNEYNAGAIGFQATNSYSSTASTQDSNFFVSVAVDGNNTLVATFTTAGNIAMGQADKGIDFSVNSQAAGATSEVLNDYEEGTFTPTLASGFSVAPTSYTNQLGRYTKIGRAVFIEVDIDPNGATGNATAVQFGGLPFTSAASPYGAVTFGFQTSFTTNAGDMLLVNNNNNVVQMYVNNGNARLGNNAGVDINARIVFSGWYTV